MNTPIYRLDNTRDLSQSDCDALNAACRAWAERGFDFVGDEDDWAAWVSDRVWRDSRAGQDPAAALARAEGRKP